MEIKNKLQIFDYNQSPVRVIDQGGQPWFVAKDVCEVLEIANHHQAINGRAGRNNEQGLDEDERGVASVTTPSGIQEMLVINESGLYTLIFKSRKAVAKGFRKWVTSEVLPEIRRNGSYSANGGVCVQGLLEKAIVDVYEGNLSLEKAAAIVSLANQYYRNEKKMTLEIPCEEVGDFAALVAALWAKDALREWTSREVRKVALEEGLFSRWLSRETVDGPSVWSRLGLLCDRFKGNVFEGVRFERHGKNRGRYFILRKEK